MGLDILVGMLQEAHRKLCVGAGILVVGTLDVGMLVGTLVVGILV